MVIPVGVESHGSDYKGLLNFFHVTARSCAALVAALAKAYQM